MTSQVLHSSSRRSILVSTPRFIHDVRLSQILGAYKAVARTEYSASHQVTDGVKCLLAAEAKSLLGPHQPLQPVSLISPRSNQVLQWQRSFSSCKKKGSSITPYDTERPSFIIPSPGMVQYPGDQPYSLNHRRQPMGYVLQNGLEDN